MELGEGYEAILAGVQDASKEFDGLGIVVGLRVQTKVLPHKITGGHVQLSFMLLRGILWTG